MASWIDWIIPGSKRKTVALDPRVVPEAAQGVAERQADPEPKHDRAPLAPWPGIDRYPTIIGSNLTLQYISSVFRLALTGYRREFCDVLDELLERDPHMYAVVAQRVHAVSGGRLDVVPASVDDGNEAEQKRADEIADYVRTRLEAIPDLKQSLAQLQWGGLYYGAGATEVNWRLDDRGWYPARLHWIHSRRIAYPDPNSWSARIWDQGMVSSWDVLSDPTGNIFGVRCEDFPGKFIVHAPSVRGNYPTRDGLGRQCAYWSALKLMGARGAAQYVERFGKPWVLGSFNTDSGDSTRANPRVATDEDIHALNAAAASIGAGSLSSAALPNSVTLTLQGPGAQSSSSGKIAHEPFINVCNGEISKAVLGQTDTTEAGPNGSRAATEIRKESTQELYRYDSACLSDTLEWQLIRWIVRLNFPEEERLCPRLVIHAAERPDPDAALKRAVMAAQAGAPVDADEVCEQAGVPVLKEPKPGETPRGRRMVPLKPIDVMDLDPESFAGVIQRKQEQQQAMAQAVKQRKPDSNEDDQSGGGEPGSTPNQ